MLLMTIRLIIASVSYGLHTAFNGLIDGLILFLYLFHVCGNLGIRSLNDFPKISQTVSGRRGC
jgi:hypothetical protein